MLFIQKRGLKMKVLFIGAGNMAQAIIHGILDKQIISKNDISIYEINEETEENVINRFKINSIESIDSQISDFEIIILAIKPQVFNNFKNDAVMKKLVKLTTINQLIVSIMAGVTIESIQDFFTECKSIIRIMPNTPALIGESMSVLSPSKGVTEKQLKIIKDIFKAIGKIEILDEKYLDAVTGLSGSGPAYVFTFIEALVQGGVLCGLTKPIAEKLAIQTVIGAASMIDNNNKIEELRHKVTSPGGTTIEGLAVLEKNKFRSSLIEAVRAAANRSKELNRKNN
jgi:pyrroline-5-carboxylate reductase